MSELIQWGGHGGISFFVSPTEIRAFKDLSISVSAETEDKTVGGEKYVSKKNSGSYKITLTAILNAALGVSVQETALAIAESARLGEQGYFYCNGQKLFPSSFMSTDATISSVTISASGAWSYAEVSWTLKQCSKYDDTSGGGNGSGSGGSGGGSGSGSGSGGSGKTRKSGNNMVDELSTDKINNKVETALSIIKRANVASQQSYNALTAVSERNKNASKVLIQLTREPIQ